MGRTERVYLVEQRRLELGRRRHRSASIGRTGRWGGQRHQDHGQAGQCAHVCCHQRAFGSAERRLNQPKGALKRRFALDDDYVEDLKAELIDAKHLAVDDGGKIKGLLFSMIQ